MTLVRGCGLIRRRLRSRQNRSDSEERFPRLGAVAQKVVRMDVSAYSLHVADCYERYARELWAAFYGMCSDTERASEAVQEAFLRFHRRGHEGLGNDRAWLLHVGRNWLRDLARRSRHGELAAELNDVCTRECDPARVTQRKELFEQVGQALSKLRGEDRQILLMRYALGWPSPRIGEVLGLRATAVDMRLMRARQRLAVLLNELGVDADAISD